MKSFIGISALAFFALLFVLILHSGQELKVGSAVLPQQAEAAENNIVYGWAWSSNIGWISFNCINDGSCGQFNYGVKVDPNSGLLSGYAWSSNIGWLSFNKSDLIGCPPTTPSCEARVSGGLTGGTYPKEVTGWVKVLYTNSWMSLRGSNYGVQLESNSDFSGWSWENGIIGWTSWKGQYYRAHVGFLPPPPSPPQQRLFYQVNSRK